MEAEILCRDGDMEEGRWRKECEGRMKTKLKNRYEPH
jgi:hypothetical protein